ncbi:nitrogen utilization protein B [Paenibacillus swuensis]|uniref:Transcription antitermination protein NusB n=1 Tax=Paenibacillus swuensis TaxID=1178515 RepID=A0A172TML5_9BACL|nr:transcription antitermination factor NusB [Paenibacillus swuensis]ANE48067.1 nitrogen utilization protein B [Paenibacillus swuensis]
MKRRLAREITVQCLYHVEMNEVSAETAVAMLIEEASQDNEANVELNDVPVLVAYVRDMVTQITAQKQQVDDVLAVYLKNWQMDRLSRVDRQILRLATFEMVFKEDVPPKVVVNEAIELSKHFGTEESGKFVNGVLGKMIKELEQIKAKSE